MIFILQLYPIVMCFVVIVGIVALISFALFWAGHGGLKRIDSTLLSTFIVFVDLQTLLGLMTLVGSARASFSGYEIVQGLAMLIAAAIAHSSALWRKSEPKLQAQVYVFTVLAVFILLFISAGIVPQGWEGPAF